MVVMHGVLYHCSHSQYLHGEWLQSNENICGNIRSLALSMHTLCILRLCIRGVDIDFLIDTSGFYKEEKYKGIPSVATRIIRSS